MGQKKLNLLLFYFYFELVLYFAIVMLLSFALVEREKEELEGAYLKGEEGYGATEVGGGG